MVCWFGEHDSMGSLEALIERTAMDAETNKLMSEATGLFMPGVQDKIIGMM